MSRYDDTLEVWLDDDLGAACQVGVLAHDRGQIRFRYAPDWLNNPHAFALDPDLSLDESPFFPTTELGNFGIFLDSSPDRYPVEPLPSSTNPETPAAGAGWRIRGGRPRSRRALASKARKAFRCTGDFMAIKFFFQ